MKTKIRKFGDTVVVMMNGRIDHETQEPLKDSLNQIIDEAKTDSAPRKVIFNFEELEFVGSSGISFFVQILREFNQMVPIRPKYCHVKSEFKKFIAAFDEDELFEFHENEEVAKKSFSH